MTWCPSTRVCGVNMYVLYREMRVESRTRVPRRRGGAVTSVLCLFLIKTFPLFSYKFASCKQVHKDPPLVKSGFE